MSGIENVNYERNGFQVYFNIVKISRTHSLVSYCTGLTIRRRVINRFEMSKTFTEKDFVFVFVRFTMLLPCLLPVDRFGRTYALRSGRSARIDYEFLERYPKKKGTFSLRLCVVHQFISVKRA